MKKQFFKVFERIRVASCNAKSEYETVTVDAGTWE
jgi:hypothetical protein